jgi:hypothetical protein
MCGFCCNRRSVRQDDRAALDAGIFEPQSNRRNALVLLLGEKEVYQHYVDLAAAAGRLLAMQVRGVRGRGRYARMSHPFTCPLPARANAGERSPSGAVAPCRHCARRRLASGARCLKNCRRCRCRGYARRSPLFMLVLPTLPPCCGVDGCPSPPPPRHRPLHSMPTPSWLLPSSTGQGTPSMSTSMPWWFHCCCSSPASPKGQAQLAMLARTVPTPLGRIRGNRGAAPHRATPRQTHPCSPISGFSSAASRSDDCTWELPCGGEPLNCGPAPRHG